VVEQDLHITKDTRLAVGRYENPVNEICAGQMQHFFGYPLTLVPEQSLGLRAQLLLNFFKRHSAALLKCEVKDCTPI
jgi:hypothetical protein